MDLNISEYILVILSVLGVTISFLMFRRAIKADVQKAFIDKMTEIKNVIFLETRVDKLENWSKEFQQIQKEQFELLHKKLDIQGEKIEKLTLELYKRGEKK